MEKVAKKQRLETKRILLHDRRVTIPKSFRDFFRLGDGSVFEISAENGHLTLQLIKR